MFPPLFSPSNDTALRCMLGARPAGGPVQTSAGGAASRHPFHASLLSKRRDVIMCFTLRRVGGFPPARRQGMGK
ncbi:hypothetical protein PBY51_005605 [Eleginops maclovinus]|uniref:Uncharacterized protein n=1 Tax=Eleginops maclovinus TaxID=56733 RepID=A0AAN8AD62_ELEMC|nr:hypothetical protein PBY51_005605 [Eleginops maclovinus]